MHSLSLCLSSSAGTGCTCVASWPPAWPQPSAVTRQTLKGIMRSLIFNQLCWEKGRGANTHSANMLALSRIQSPASCFKDIPRQSAQLPQVWPGCSCILRKRLTVHTNALKNGAENVDSYLARGQSNYNFAHGFICPVSSVTTTNHMDKSRLGKTIGLLPGSALKTILFIMPWKNYSLKKIKHLAPHWFYTSDWLLSVRSCQTSSTRSVLWCPH